MRINYHADNKPRIIAEEQLRQKRLENTTKDELQAILSKIVQGIIQDEKYTVMDLARMADMDVLELTHLVWPDFREV